MIAGLVAARETLDVPVMLDIERTAESFHAHAIPEDVEIREGDSVLVHGAPAYVEFGEKLTMACRATVTRATPLERFWTRVTAMFELTELYETGFGPKDDE